MTSWEYIKKRRGWTANTIIAGLEDKSWDSFQSFFTQRGIKCPEKVEYDLAFKAATPAKIQYIQPPKKAKPLPVTETAKSTPKVHTRKNKKKIVKT